MKREGNWFGATVNLAARVSAAAAGGEALVTEATRMAAGEVEAWSCVEYCFCSLGCAGAFAQDPGAYLASGPSLGPTSD